MTHQKWNVITCGTDIILITHRRHIELHHVFKNKYVIVIEIFLNYLRILKLLFSAPTQCKSRWRLHTFAVHASGACSLGNKFIGFPFFANHKTGILLPTTKQAYDWRQSSRISWVTTQVFQPCLVLLSFPLVTFVTNASPCQRKTSTTSPRNAFWTQV